MNRRLVAFVAACAMGTSLAACGDDEDSADGGGETAAAPTEEEFIQQADQICLDVNRELASIPSRAFPTEGAELISGALDELRSLTPPEGQEQEVEELIAAGEEGLNDLEQNERGDPFAEFTRLAEEFGLKGGCTRNEG